MLVKGIMRQILDAEWKKRYGRSIDHHFVDQYYVAHQKLYRNENSREVVYDTMVFDIIHRYPATTDHLGGGQEKLYKHISQQYYNITVVMVKEYDNLVNRTPDHRQKRYGSSASSIHNRTRPSNSRNSTG